MEFYERVSGARMHAAYFRPGGVHQDISEELLKDIDQFCTQFYFRLQEISNLLNENRIWRQRLLGVGKISAIGAKTHGFTGVLLRSTGIRYDIRRNSPYEIYEELEFDTPIGKNGDCLDRYSLRMSEMCNSLDIIKQAISLIKQGPIKNTNLKFTPPSRNLAKTSMETLIHHFKYFGTHLTLLPSEIYVGIESPKGEFGVYLASAGGKKPYRCKIKSPGYTHLQGLDYMSYTHFLADITTIIGTQDVVFGEIDR